MRSFVLFVTTLYFSSFTALTWASDAAALQQELRQRLSQIEQFSANFTQEVISSEGQLIHKAKGQLAILMPGNLRWLQEEPEQDEIISDGTTIWYFNPFVEQVSIFNADEAIKNTPFILLADQSESLWSDYLVTQQDDWYWIKSKTEEDQPGFALRFNADADIEAFVIEDREGQRSEFALTEVDREAKLSREQFSFEIPEHVAIDDQR